MAHGSFEVCRRYNSTSACASRAPRR